MDAGDEMQGSLLSNLGDGTATGKGIPTIVTYNAMGYNVATFGNHEFDWGQVNLTNRTSEATYPYVTANIVKNDTGNCATAGWAKPDFADAPYSGANGRHGPEHGQGRFHRRDHDRDPDHHGRNGHRGPVLQGPGRVDPPLLRRDEGRGADVIVVLSHLGYADGGYGYGIPVYGDQTLAAKLNTAGKPVNLIIGGHSHTQPDAPATMVGNTAVVQAYYNGRTVGRADVTVTPAGAVSVVWSRKTGFDISGRHPGPDDRGAHRSRTRPIRPTWRSSTRRSATAPWTCRAATPATT